MCPLKFRVSLTLKFLKFVPRVLRGAYNRKPSQGPQLRVEGGVVKGVEYLRNKNEIDLELQIFLAGQNSHILEYSSVVVLIITKERNRERKSKYRAGGGPVPSIVLQRVIQ